MKNIFDVGKGCYSSHHQNLSVLATTPISKIQCQTNPSDTHSKKDNVKSVRPQTKSLSQDVPELRSHTTDSSTEEKNKDRVKCQAS